MHILNGSISDDEGRLYATLAAPGSTTFFNNGLAFAADGAVHITETLTPSDVYLRGMRISVTGQLIVQLP